MKSLNKRTVKILDAEYEKADLNKVVSENIHLSTAERTELLKLLEKYVMASTLSGLISLGDKENKLRSIFTVAIVLDVGRLGIN